MITFLLIAYLICIPISIIVLVVITDAYEYDESYLFAAGLIWPITMVLILAMFMTEQLVRIGKQLKRRLR